MPAKVNRTIIAKMPAVAKPRRVLAVRRFLRKKVTQLPTQEAAATKAVNTIMTPTAATTNLPLQFLVECEKNTLV